MPKRANGEGSIRKRSDGNFESRAMLNGKRVSFYAKTQAEANRMKTEALAAAAAGRYIEHSKMTVAQWLTEWEETYGRPRWRDTTATTNHQSITNHLIPAFGNIPLQKLAPVDIQRFIISRQKEKAEPASIIKQLSPLKSAMRQAVLLKLRTDNPFEAVKMPKPVQDEIQFLTEDEQRAYAAALPDSTTGRLLRFTLCTGLRIGEALSLCWSDVEKDFFTVRRTIATVSTQGETDKRTKQSIQPTKTGAGLRTISLSPDMRSLLERQHKSQAAEKLKAGAAWGIQPDGIKIPEGDSFVFATSIGTPIQRRNAQRVHEKALKAANVKRITLHGLRHSFATRWVAQSSDIRGLSEVLGHADVATTLRRYVHSNEKHKAEMMQIMGSL